MKRFLPLLLSLALLILPAAAAEPPNGELSAAVYNYEDWQYDPPQNLPLVRLRLNGRSVAGEMPGVILGGRTLAPLRLLAEGLGATVEWLPDSGQVLVTRDEDEILLTLGSAFAQVNGQERELPDGIPATTLSYEDQGYTMVPLRFFSETLDCQVDWDGNSYTASVTQRGYIAQQASALLGPLEGPAEPGKYLIALDAGHGGSASGAFYEEAAEKDLTLAMTEKVEAFLNALGYRTVMTRQGDEYVDLYTRAAIANWSGADLFVSIHCNAADHHPDFQGLYVYHYPGSEAGAALAQALQDEICAATGAVDRGIESEDFVVVRETDMPAVLVETGFMTCHEELERLRDEDYQTRLAQGVVQGIARYLRENTPQDAGPAQGVGAPPSGIPLDG